MAVGVMKERWLSPNRTEKLLAVRLAVTTSAAPLPSTSRAATPVGPPGVRTVVWAPSDPATVHVPAAALDGKSLAGRPLAEVPTRSNWFALITSMTYVPLAATWPGTPEMVTRVPDVRPWLL